MIEMQDIVKQYTLGGEIIYALDHVSLRVEKGEYVTIIGPSGSGKSTLMNLIGCLDTADSGTYDKLKNKPNQLSGGQQQRCAIARAIAVNPSLILADEPTGNLDQKTGREILNIFDELHQAGNTIVLITHDLKVALCGQRMIRIEDGRLYEPKEADADDLSVV